MLSTVNAELREALEGTADGKFCVQQHSTVDHTSELDDFDNQDSNTNLGDWIVCINFAPAYLLKLSEISVLKENRVNNQSITAVNCVAGAKVVLGFVAR